MNKNYFRKISLLAILISIISFSNVQAQSYEIDNVNGQNISTCTGTFYDSGGSAGDYANNENYSVRFTSDDSNPIQIAFSAWDVEDNATCAWDVLRIYDGIDNNATLIGTYCTNSPGTVTSTNPSNALFFEFESDISVAESGWTATISCVTPPGPPADPCDPVASGNTDTDNDGITDICDLDDDNDGISDIDEGYIEIVLPELFFITLYHGNIINSTDSRVFMTGEDANPAGGDNDINTLSEVVSGGPLSGVISGDSNWPNYRGTNVQGFGASDGSNAQYGLLTTESIYIWGDNSDMITMPGTSWDSIPFPSGRLATDFVSITSGVGIIALVSTTGEVYTIGSTVRSNNSIYGNDNAAADANGWRKVETTNGAGVTDLVGVVRLTISHEGAFAITSSGDWYTWGENSYLGDGTGNTDRDVATLMTKPAGVTHVQSTMTADDEASYYVLGTDGLIYSLGENGDGQLGDNSTTDRNSWVNVEISTGANLTGVTFITGNSYSYYYPGAGAIVASGSLNEIYLWGHNSQNKLSSAATTPQDYAIKPAYYTGTNVGQYLDYNGDLVVNEFDRNPVRLGVGGHQTIYYDEYQANYCLVGHNINGSFGTVSVTDASLFSVSNASGGSSFPSQLDTDMDGIPDYLDTDSDNDGCPDATEGGNHLNSTDFLSGGSNGGSSENLGTSTIDSTGFPAVSGVPQTNTTSKLTSDSIISVTLSSISIAVCEGLNEMLVATPLGERVVDFGATGAASDDSTIAIPAGEYVYSWYKNSAPSTILSTSDTLFVIGATMADAGTYTVEVKTLFNDCPAITAAILISTQTPLDAGSNGTLTICEGETVTAGELFTSLTGSPDAGGVWTPALAGAGTYTYTHAANGACPAVSSEVVVTEQTALNAGSNGSLTICAGETVTAGELFTSLVGSPDGGGVWTPALAGAGTYTYTHAATGECPLVSAEVEVTEQPALDAGSDGALTICAGETVTAGELFTSLVGSPDGGGVWTPALAGAGTYTYTHAATGECPLVSAEVEVTEQPALDAGSNGTLTICAGETVTAGELFTSLVGSPDGGGVWTPALAGAGTYTYTHAATGECPLVSAEVEVTEQPALNAGSDGALTICAGETVTAGELFTSLVGSPDGGGVWTPVLAGAGTYTYTHAANGACPAVSSEVEVTEQPALDAGSDGALTICAGETVTAGELFTSLLGSPDGGGVWTPALAGAGTYTYTHAATGECPLVSAEVEVTEQPALDAGSDGALTICAGETVTAGELFTSLVGSPDGGGVWTPALAGAGTYTYTHAATGECPLVSAEVEVTEQPALDAGSDGALTICAGETVTAGELFTSLVGSPDGGGVWTPALAGAGTYTYTHAATGECPLVSAEVEVTEQSALDAGSDGALTICAGETVTSGELFTSLVGSPDAGGVWTPALAGAGTYTYTHAATGECPLVSAEVEVTEQPALDAGSDGALTICAGETVTAGELFTSLVGSPDGGGIWTPALAGAGTYTYTHAATGECPLVSAEVEVTEQPALDAGSDGALTICAGETVTAGELFTSLVGSPDAGGVWTPALAGAGTYTYTHAATGECPLVSAEVEVTEQPALDAGSDGALTICAGETVTAGELFTSLVGSPDAGGVWTPALAGAGTYTYTHAATGECPLVSAEVEVTEQSALDAGSDGALTICAGETVTAGELFTSLVGSPDAGGVWTPALAGAGTYTYTHAATGECPLVSAEVEVTEQSALDAGSDGALTICEGETVTSGELFTSLVGSPDAGGVWTPALAGAGTYTYTHAAFGTCLETSSEVEVTEQALPIASAGSDTSICHIDSAILGGSTQAGLNYQWSTASGDILGATSSNLTVYPSDTTVYFLEVSDNLGCESISSVTVNVFICEIIAVNDTNTTAEETAVIIEILLNDIVSGDIFDTTSVDTTGLVSPINGAIIINNNGTITYTPNNGFNGVDSFEYSICDADVQILCDTAWVFITVAPVNDTPTVSQPPVIVFPEDSFYVFCPPVMDPDMGDSLTITSCGDPVNGTYTIDAMNCITYTPTANYNGLDSMCVVVCDNGVPVLCDSIYVPITVLPVNDPPVANNDNGVVNEDNPVTVSVPTNDNDDLDPLGNIDSTTVDTTGLTGPLNGTVTNIDPVTGDMEYTPNNGFNGVDSFQYVICDDGNPLPALCDTAWVFITVAPVNDTPTVSQPPVIVFPEDSFYVFCPPVMDPDMGDSLTITSCGDPVNGTYTIDAMNCITYTPTANYNGLDSMCVVVCDNGVPVLCDSIYVPITVTPVNDPPVANNDFGTVNEDNPVTVSVPTNDNDDLDPLGNIDSTTVDTTGLTGPLNGTVTNIDPVTGDMEYTPNNGFNGVDSFQYVICDDGNPLPALCDTAWVFITVAPVNDTPTVSQPPVIEFPEDSTWTFCPPVMDPDMGDSLTITSCGDPVNGTYTIDSMNCITYVPTLNFNGLDSMCVIVCDNGVPVLCDSIMVPITVTPVNDPPVANNDFGTVNEDNPVTVSVPTNDNDDLDPLGNIDSTTVDTTGLTGPLNGTVTNIDPVTGDMEYTPNNGFNGVDSFQYVICDDGNPLPALCDTAWVFITVAPVNDTPTVSQPPVIEFPEDSTWTFCPPVMDPDMGDSLTITSCGDPVNGTYTIDSMNCITYVPTLNYNGLDSMCVIVCDNGVPVLCDSIMVPITVTPVNDPPVANNDFGTVNEDNPVTVSVPTNDNDDLDPLGNIDSTTVDTTGLTGPLNGTVTNIDPVTGDMEYTPNNGFNGVDSFQYVICDDGNPLPALCDTAWVFITVAPVNDTPTVSQPPVIEFPEDSTWTFCPPVMDPDMGDSLTITSCGDPVNGTYTIDSMNCITYVPTLNYNGLDSMCVIVCDNGVPVLCDSIMVPITVTPVNDPPVANNDFGTVNEDNPVTVDVPTNDNDDLDPLGNIDSTTVDTTGLTGPLNGTVTNIDPVTGDMEYTPNNGFNGVDSFQYVICDDGNPLPALCDTAWVFITVAPVNDTPTVSQPPVIEFPEDSTWTFCPPVMDPDMGDSLTITSCGDPVNGTYTIDSMNCITYVPTLNFNGLDSMCVVVCDNGVPVLCDSIYVPITVTPVNDPPVANNDFGTVNEDNPVTVSVPTNDNDDLDPLGNIDSTTVDTTGLTGPLNGTVTNIDPVTGDMEYTPNNGFNGVDSFQYVICDDGNPLPALCDTAWVFITVAPVNDTPTVSQPPVIEFPEDSTWTFCPPVMDPDMGDSLTITSCGDPVNGTYTIDSMNCITYVPTLNFNGLDSMCVIVCDNGVPVLCDSIMVPITVTPVNDLPVANNDFGTVNEDNPVTVSVPTNDNDDLDPLGNIDSTTVDTTGLTGPLNGTVTNIDPVTGDMEYTPNNGFNGVDSFQYVICDDGNPLPALCDTAWVFITVAPVNDTPTVSQPPVIEFPEDSTWTFCPPVMDPDMGDSLTITSCGDPVNGTYTIDSMNCITYVPTLNYNGLDSMCVIVCDNGVPVLCDSIMVPITVTPVNDPPVANNDFGTVNEDNPVTVSVPTNDNDDLDPLGNIDSTTVDTTGLTGPLNGTVTNIDPVTGDMEYTPNNGFNGVDSFQYVICDDGNPLPALCDTAWVFITVVPVNDTPTIGQPPVIEFPEDSTWTFCPPIMDVDSGDVLTVTSCGNPENGVITIDSNNCVTYVPAPNYNGTDTICLIVCDDGVPILCDTIYVPVLVLPVNDPPVANDDEETTTYVTPVTVDVPFNDNDDLDPLGNIDPETVNVISGPNNGGVEIDPSTGEVIYTPDTLFVGIDSFQYVICDDGNPLPALCDTAWVFITVTPIDTDGDGVTDDVEPIDGTDPLDPCDFIPESITFPVTAIVNCDDFLIPTGFSPNNDGVNDNFVILGIERYPNAKLLIINRWGNKVYESENGYLNDWDGTNQFGMTVGTRELPVGTYFLILDLGDGSDIKKGYVYLNK